MAKRVVIDGSSLTVEEVHRVARGGARVALSAESKRAIRECKKFYDSLVRRGEPVSGSTVPGDGAGGPRETEHELETRIIHAHVAGTGNPHPIEVVRAAMLCRVNTYANGHGAASPSLVAALIELLNRGITPLVYEKGPVGTTGTMAQVAEVLMGLGEAYYNGELLPGALAMKKARLDFLIPNHREGLSLINGPHIMTGELVLCCYDARNLLKNAIVASAMTIDALHVSRYAFDPRVHALRSYPGQCAVAENIRILIEGSMISRDTEDHVPDAHSLQCTPQILGPTFDALSYVTHLTQIEMNASAEDILFFADEKVYLSGGHVHGQPIAMAADFLSIAMAEVASLSERHINRLLNPALSGLPGFLVEGEGLITGLVSAQYTAASLVSENKALAHPGVVDSISISADREDHVSMGPVSIRKLRQIITNTTAVIAIELLCAAQAFDFRKPQKPGNGTRAAYRKIRKEISHLEYDRPLYPDIQKTTELVEEGAVVKAVERRVGPLVSGEYTY